jgi:GMP synthase (glutamine-hydrolysing)
MQSGDTLPLSIWVTGEPVPAAARRAGSFADMIRATVGDSWAAGWSEIDVREGRAALPRPDEVAGVIITGSAARIADQLPWMRRAQSALREHVEHGVAVLGICFGHQLLGVALGGRSGPNPHGREIGTVTLTTLREDALLADMRTAPVSMTHLDAVLELPAGARIIGETALDSHAAIQFAELAWGVQFHPEIDAAVMRDYVAALRGRIVDEGLEPERLDAAIRDTPDAARVLKRFAEKAASTAQGRAAGLGRPAT